MVSSVIIIGASAAGVSAARTLRDEGFNGCITLIDADPHGAYERPPLSKSIIQNSALTADDIALLTEDDAANLRITTRYGISCTALSSDGSAELETGEVLKADKIILATGGSAKTLPIKSAHIKGLHTLRTFADTAALRHELSQPKTIAVIGGGLIGSEVVASLAGMQHKIHWIDAAAMPLVHIIPKAIVEPLLKWHQSNGVSLKVSAQISNFETNDKNELIGVSFTDGSTMEADLALMGIGMTPDTKLARSLGLELAENGIAVDEHQQTSHANIYAAGDVAAIKQADGSFQRHEHWQAAEHQGANAARHILGTDLMAEPLQWFWSDQADNHLEMTGCMGEQSVTRQAKNEKWPIVFEMTNAKLVGAVSINNPNAVRIASRLIKSSKHVSIEELADPSVNLRVLLRR